MTVSTSPIPVCQLAELPIGLGRAYQVGNKTIAIFRTRAGKLFATDNRCPHKAGPLSEGLLAGDTIVCPLHAFRFELSTGTCDQPDTCAVVTYPITERAGMVYIELPVGS